MNEFYLRLFLYLSYETILFILIVFSYITICVIYINVWHRMSNYHILCLLMFHKWIIYISSQVNIMRNIHLWFVYAIIKTLKIMIKKESKIFNAIKDIIEVLHMTMEWIFKILWRKSDIFESLAKRTFCLIFTNKANFSLK